jgi:hypothetical protein
MRTIIFYTVFLLLFTACEEWNIHTYNVPSEFTPYVDKFKADAKRFGYDFDKKGLIIRFADLDNNIAGLAYYKRNPILIEIDREYWASAGNAKNGHDIKENLIFHELGHGFLQRMHDNTVLQNGDWKTMMCGDKLPNNRASNINYRGFRKEYYIEELFTRTNDVPAWSTLIPQFDNINENIILQQDFSTNSDWSIGSNSLYESSIKNGLYTFTTKTSQAFYVLNKGTLNATNDFYIEVAFKQATNQNESFGLIVGSYKEQDTPTSLHYFYQKGDNHIYIGESECLGPFIDLYSELLKPNDFNTFAIRKHNNFLYYYINDTFIYHNDLDEKIALYGTQVGFKIPGNSTLNVDYAEIRESNTDENMKAKKRNASILSIEEANEREVINWQK